MGEPPRRPLRPRRGLARLAAGDGRRGRRRSSCAATSRASAPPRARTSRPTPAWARPSSRPLLERLSLRRFRSESGEELLDVARAPLPDPDTPAPVRFLPTWDATLLVHARRTGLLPERHRPQIFHVKNPHSLPTFLVDGAVAGSWRYDDERIELDPFGPLDAADLRQLRDEGERLAAFHD